MTTVKPFVLKPLSEAQQACVDLLEETLIEAKKGAIETIGIIACLKSGYASVMAGSNASSLNLGCDSMKKKILDAVEGPRSSIIRQ